MDTFGGQTGRFLGKTMTHRQGLTGSTGNIPSKGTFFASKKKATMNQ
jgi:hypothetical protein